MAETPETKVEGPNLCDEDPEAEMLGEGHSLHNAYLLRLAKEGFGVIKRGDFVVAHTREDLRRILRD